MVETNFCFSLKAIYVSMGLDKVFAEQRNITDKFSGERGTSKKNTNAKRQQDSFFFKTWNMEFLQILW